VSRPEICYGRGAPRLANRLAEREFLWGGRWPRARTTWLVATLAASVAGRLTRDLDAADVPQAAVQPLSGCEGQAEGRDEARAHGGAKRGAVSGATQIGMRGSGPKRPCGKVSVARLEFQPRHAETLVG